MADSVAAESVADSEGKDTSLSSNLPEATGEKRPKPKDEKSSSASPSPKKKEAAKAVAKTKSSSPQPKKKGPVTVKPEDEVSSPKAPASGDGKPKSGLKPKASAGKTSAGAGAGAVKTGAASINCKCGSVKIDLGVRSAAYHFECCCYDCCAALRYACTKRSGPKNPESQVADTYLFNNDFTVSKGQDKIGAFKNYANGDAVRFHCMDCWTLLLTSHPFFQQKLISTTISSHQDFSGLQSLEKMDVESRQFLKDVKETQLAALPPFAGDPSNVYQANAPTLAKIIESGKKGEQMNSQVLLAKIGQPLVPKDDPLLTMGPDSLMSQLAEEQEDAEDTKTSAKDVSDVLPESAAVGKASAEKGKANESANKAKVKETTASSKPSISPKKAKPPAIATLISTRPQIPTSGAASARAVKTEEKRASRSKQALEEEAASLSNVWPRLGMKGNVLRIQDVEQLLSAAGAKVSADAIEDFMKKELGSTTVSETQFAAKATSYFNTCVPNEECMELWQMAGGRLGGEGTIEAYDFKYALEKAGCRLSQAEVDDLVAFASYGNDQLAYDDFVRALFP